MAEQSLNINSKINLGLPAQPPDSLQNPEVIALAKLLINTSGILLRALEQYVGITPKDASSWPELTPTDTLLRHQAGRIYPIVGEPVAYGAFVHLYNDANNLKVRNANSVGGFPAHGYCNVVGGSGLGDYTEIILSQGILPVTGLLPGQSIYLSSTDGVASLVPDTGAGRTEQYLGIGIAMNLAYIDISLGQYIQH